MNLSRPRTPCLIKVKAKKHSIPFLGVKECIQTLIIQAIEEPYIEALKEDYIGYGGRMPYQMIEHLQMKISKVTNKDKVQPMK